MNTLIAQVDWQVIRGKIQVDHGNIKNLFLPQPGVAGGGKANVSGIIDLVLPYLFVIAGLALLGMLIFGGISMMLSANNENDLKKAQGTITNALLGFLMLFISYWLVQIIEAILGITIF